MVEDVLRFRRTACIVLSILLHAFASALFLRDSASYPPQWRLQFFVFLFGSIALTFGVVYVRTVAYRYVFSFVKLLVIFFMLIPARSGDSVRVFLALSAVIESSLLLPVVLQVLLLILGAGYLIPAPGPVLVWDTVLNPEPISDNVPLFGFYLLGGTLALFIRLIAAKADALQRQIENRLHAAHRLARVNVELQDSIALLEKRVIRNERERVSRELHDIVGYAMTNQIMTMEAALRLSEKHQDELRDVIVQAREAAQTALRDTRLAMRNFRAETSSLTLELWNIEKLAEAFQNTGIIVNVEYRNTLHIHFPRFQKLVYRFVQEGITNAIQHGHATHIDVLFWQEDNILTVTVMDNGEGSESVINGIGISGIGERLAAVGGDVAIEPHDRGFVLRARIPLSSIEDER